jgi:hypothetical protein
VGVRLVVISRIPFEFFLASNYFIGKCSANL